MTEPDRRRAAGPALKLVLLAAAALWILVAVASSLKSPTVGGVLGGIFGGFLLALFVAGAGAWTVLLLFVPSVRGPAEETATQLNPTLEQTLHELEVVRADTAKKIRARTLIFAPLGGLAGLAFWIATQFGDDPGDITELLMFAGAGAFGGYMWAAHKLAAAYAQLYKSRVLPLLAAQFGALSWRPGQPDLDALRRYDLLGSFDRSSSDDEIFGERRGLPLTVTELSLTSGSGKNERNVFRGLLVTVTLPRMLSGVTAITNDHGMLGNMTRRIEGERVRLEDAEFEKSYEVYSTDQIGARALLTPAFMQRFMALASSGRFGKPLALAQGNSVLMALPGSAGLFSAPSYSKPAAAQSALRELTEDLRRVIEAADAIIDLDQAGRLTRAG